jgi:hypothetical protein
MAAQSTAIANIYEPAIWSQYFLEAATAKNKLVQSGIAASSPEIEDAASKGGRFVDMPFWDDLAHDTAATTRSKVVTDTDDKISPAGVTTEKDTAVKHFRAQAFQVAPIVKYAAGQDPVQVVVDRLANWWVSEEQRLLLLTLQGIFADTTIASVLQKDISVETTTTNAANLISSSAILDTQFLLGDAFDKFTAMVMHSTVYKRLKNLDLVDEMPDSQQVGSVIRKYGNLDVLIDDGMTTVAGSTSGYKYHTYLFGAGAIGRADVPLESGDPNVEIDRDPMAGTGAGLVNIISRRYFLLHPRGIAYADANMAGVSPSDAELIDGDNWTQKYLTKNIRIARLITNG